MSIKVKFYPVNLHDYHINETTPESAKKDLTNMIRTFLTTDMFDLITIREWLNLKNTDIKKLYSVTTKEFLTSETYGLKYYIDYIAEKKDGKLGGIYFSLNTFLLYCTLIKSKYNTYFNEVCYKY